MTDPQERNRTYERTRTSVEYVPGQGLVRFATTIGTCGLTYTDSGILRLHLPELPGADRRRPLRPTARAARAPCELHGPTIDRVIERIRRHLAGDCDSLRDVALDLDATSESARRIYTALRRVPPGQTTTYAELARRAGLAGAARAVGRAMAANPLPLIVPCHRVLKADGSLGHYSAPRGPSLKLRLLTLEGADLRRVAQRAGKQLSAQDPHLAAAIRRSGPHPLHLPPDTDHFTALVHAIVNQQLSVRAGSTIFARLRAAIGSEQRIDPQQLLQCPSERLRAAGLSARKTSYVRDLALHCVDKDLELDQLARLDDEAVVDRLTAIKGIGRWTAQMFLIFSLRRLNVLPLDDLGIRRAVERLYALAALPTEAQLQRLADSWRPFRSVAAWYLWRSLELSVGSAQTSWQ